MHKLPTLIAGLILGLCISLGFAANGAGYNPNVMFISSEGQLPTYSVAAADITPASGATDVFCIQGSATQTVKVSRVQFSAGATTSTSIDVVLIKRSQPNVNGVSSVPIAITVAAHDSANPTFGASVFYYASNPVSVGAGIPVRADEVGVALDVNGYPNSPFIWDFGTRNSQYIVLHGTNESLCVNMNGVPLPAGIAVYIDAELLVY